MELVKGLGPQFKHNYVRLIAAGHIESTALATLAVDWMDFFEVCAKDPEFRSDIDLARKSRADVWVDNIALSLQHTYWITDANGQKLAERPPNKDEIARDKLHFEKHKFLAQADNPDKYSPGAKPKITLDIDLSDFKLLTPQESLKVLHNDPFNKMVTIEAEVTKEAPDGKEE